MTKKYYENVITTFHDNLLADLYSLTIDNVYHKNLDGLDYLINETKGRGYNIGLQVQIPVEMLTYNNTIKEYKDLSKEEQMRIIEALKERLFFSNAEILMSNILLDKFSDTNENASISFIEIESYYRKQNKSRVQLTYDNYKRYIDVINKLVDKEIFIKTTGCFREKEYGVNNLSFQQPFLVLFDNFDNGRYNKVFSYSFDRLGDVLKLSRRVSENVPSSAYTCRLNQCMLHTVYYFLGLEVFWKKWLLRKHQRLESYKYFRLDLQKLMERIHYEKKKGNTTGHSVAYTLANIKDQQNKLRTYKLIVKYVLLALKEMKKNHIIYDYEEKYTYKEDDKFVEKYQDDYVGDNLKLVHLFSVNEIDSNVDIEITIFLEPVEFKIC